MYLPSPRWRRILVVQALSVLIGGILLLLSREITRAAPDFEIEPNDSPGQATTITWGTTIQGAIGITVTAPVTTTDIDYYKIVTSVIGNNYRLSFIIPYNPNQLSVRLRLYDGALNLIDETVGTSSIVLSWRAYTTTHYVELVPLSFQSPSVPTSTPLPTPGPVVVNYLLSVVQIANTPTPAPTATGTATPIPTPTPPPTPTPAGFPDAFEPNYDFDHATLIGLGQKYTGLNFVPVTPGTEDNDFFKLWVKPGMLITCETLDLTPGTDTNLIVYDANRNGIVGNDDVNPQAGELGSRVTVMATWEGWMYLLVGQGGRGIVYGSGYSLQCNVGLPPTATPTPTRTPRPITEIPPPPTATPAPTSTPIPTATPTPVRLQVQALAATPTPAGRRIEVTVEVYYDANGSGAMDPGEGVVDLPAWLVSLRGGQVIARGATDEEGRVILQGFAEGVVRLVIPYLGVVRPVENGQTVTIRLNPVSMPARLP